MEELEKTSAAPTAPVKSGSTLLARLFGLFAFLFGLPYLIQGLSIVAVIFSARYVRASALLLPITFLVFDVVLAVAAMIIGVGLVLLKEWARKGWLVFLIVLLLVHFHMTIIQLLAGQSNMSFLYKWIAVVIFVSLLSWFYLTRAATKARFQKLNLQIHGRSHRLRALIKTPTLFFGGKHET